METELLKLCLDNIRDLTKANQDLTDLVRSVKDECAQRTQGYRDELHMAKNKCEMYEAKITDLMKRCDRLQEKYDALHEKYDALVVSSITKSAGTTAKSNVKINV